MNHTLSSTAERSFWLGRYLERAESTARLVMVNGRLLYDLPKRLPLGWQQLIEITGNGGLFEEIYAEPNERNISRFLINDTRNSSSLLSSLGQARENVRTLRGIIPRHAVEYMNELYLFGRDALSEPLSRSRRARGLQGILQVVQRIEGFMSANMLHDAHWSFFRLGNYIERADMTSRIIEAGSDNIFESVMDLEPYADIQWRSVLLALDAGQAYNTVVQEPIQQAAVIEFLVRNEQLPRSLAFSLNSARNSLRKLPRHDRVLRLLNRERRNLRTLDCEAADADAIRQFMDNLQMALADINSAIMSSYFQFEHKSRARQGRTSA